MKRFIAPIVLLATAGCQNTYLNVSVGPQIDPIFNGASGWEGSGPIVDIEIERRMDQWFCKYTHTSNLFSGPPFNSEQETTLDRITCGRSFRLR